MTTLASHAFTDLRGTPDERPTFDPALRRHLQSAIDEALWGVEGPLTVTKTSVNKVLQCEGRYKAHDPFAWTLPMAIGSITHKAIELNIGGVQGEPVELVDPAKDRLCATNESFAEFINGLSAEEVWEATHRVVAYLTAYQSMIGHLPLAWYPNVEATTQAWTGHRRVTFFGRIDLKVGVLDGQRSNTLLIDFKTGQPGPSDMDDLRLYALLETLRTGVPPFRWANFYLATGTIVHEDASETLLFGAAERLAVATLKIANVKNSDVVLTPGPHCKFCPAMLTCEEAML